MKVLIPIVIGLLVVGCGKNNNSAKNPAKGLTIENLSGVYEREVDGMLFKLVIDKSGSFKDYFQNLFDDLSGSTFMEQAGGNCKIVEKEVHFHYQAPVDLAESGHVNVFRVQQDGSLALIAGIANGKRHDLPEEEQAETHDWLKRSDSVANKGFRIVNPKPTPAFTKKQEAEAKELLDAFGNDDPTSTPDSASSSDTPSPAPTEDPSKGTTPKKDSSDKVIGEYAMLGDPSKKMVLRAGGISFSSEDGKPSEDEEGTWYMKNGDVHITSDGEIYIFEVNGNGNLQVTARLKNGVREDAPERMRRHMILKKIKPDTKGTPSKGDDNNSTSEKPTKELTKEDVVGTYEEKNKDGDIKKIVFHENGKFELFENGDKFIEGTWKMVGKEAHLDCKSVILVCKIEPNGDLASIARIRNSKREEVSKREQLTLKKIK